MCNSYDTEDAVADAKVQSDCESFASMRDQLPKPLMADPWNPAVECKDHRVEEACLARSGRTNDCEQIQP